MRLRLRIRTLLLLVAAVAIVIGAGRWFERRRAFCLARAREHEAVVTWYELALSVDPLPTSSWAAPQARNPSRRAEYEAIVARHREVSRRYARAASRVWVSLPAAPPDFPKPPGFLPLP